jgi:2'-5' RNA ligase
MVAALEIYFDLVAERRLRTLWTALEDADVATLGGHTHRRHRPHLSLVVADDLPPQQVVAALAGMPLPPPLPLTFQFVGQFPGGVLWLGPAPTPELLAVQAEVVERLDAADVPISELYRPGTWVPHTTLSMTARRDAVARAVPVCCDVLPIPVTLMSAAIVDHTRSLFTPLPRPPVPEPAHDPRDHDVAVRFSP